MSLIIFWLMPVVLLLVLILLVLPIIKPHRNGRLYVIEPLGWLVTTWQVARFEPNTQSLARLFKVLASSNLSKGTLLEQIIVSAAGALRIKSQTTSATLIEHQSIGPLAERFVLEISTKTQSVIVGPLEQIGSLVEDENMAKYRILSQKSADHGYLALTIATAFVHGDKPKRTKHRIEGLVVIEPKVAVDRAATLQKLGQDSVRFLSVAPVGFTRHLYQQIFPDQAPFGLDAKELETVLPPKFAEADLEKAGVVGGADIVARHQALRTWQRRFDCVVVSINPEDRDLPITPKTNII